MDICIVAVLSVVFEHTCRIDELHGPFSSPFTVCNSPSLLVRPSGYALERANGRSNTYCGRKQNRKSGRRFAGKVSLCHYNSWLDKKFFCNSLIG